MYVGLSFPLPPKLGQGTLAGPPPLKTSKLLAPKCCGQAGSVPHPGPSVKYVVSTSSPGRSGFLDEWILEKKKETHEGSPCDVGCFPVWEGGVEPPSWGNPPVQRGRMRGTPRRLVRA